jgi:hypothetical protein
MLVFFLEKDNNPASATAQSQILTTFSAHRLITIIWCETQPVIHSHLTFCFKS